MTIRILPAVGDPDAARAVAALLGQLPDAEPAPAVADSTALLNALAGAAGSPGATQPPTAAGPPDRPPPSRRSPRSSWSTSGSARCPRWS
ncbi:hypothetical protein [Streptomyces noursei]|uniref:hypothetical protein n=1 Tax=Streptomyces noursei TaxID=1971 RepID=UPI0022A7988D|nr:hypothetical protein [Streptomyces noursei]MCZ1017776.1 hypothetical protein [Streptomyces noursei]